jgi:hypothetical protein
VGNARSRTRALNKVSQTATRTRHATRTTTRVQAHDWAARRGRLAQSESSSRLRDRRTYPGASWSATAARGERGDRPRRLMTGAGSRRTSSSRARGRARTGGAAAAGHPASAGAFLRPFPATRLSRVGGRSAAWCDRRLTGRSTAPAQASKTPTRPARRAPRDFSCGGAVPTATEKTAEMGLRAAAQTF